MTREPVFSRKPELAREAAKKILAEQRAFNKAPPEYVVVSPRDFSRLDLNFYDATQQWLEQQGFVLLGDIENRKATQRLPGICAFTRTLRSADGLIGAGVQHYLYEVQGVWRRVWCRIKNWGYLGPRVESRLVSFGTRLSDGTELATSVTSGTDVSSDMPGLLVCKLPEATPLDEVLATHRERLRRWLGGHPEGHPVPAWTLEESITSSYEWHDRIMAHQRSIGYVTQEQLIQEVGEQDGVAVYEAIQALLKEERGAAA